MKILMVNKFLYPNGGSETYIFELGRCLINMGHEVQYFGMEHEGRIVGNDWNIYTDDMEFHGGSSLFTKLMYPFKIIYSREAYRKMLLIMDKFMPDVVHLNNINFQLTPSIIEAVRDYDRKHGVTTKIVTTAHDYQWVCPNHMLKKPSGELCFECENSKFGKCMANSCIHGSKLRSTLGTIEANTYSRRHTYAMVDKIICPSEFIKNKLETNRDLSGRCVMMHNFMVSNPEEALGVDSTEQYVLYFGRFSEEKGIKTLLKSCKELKDIKFKMAGNGPFKDEIDNIPNIENLGFLLPEDMKKVIVGARFVVFPSEWYENCPFSVMEAQQLKVPTIASNLGGTPELIMDGISGELFEAGNSEELSCKIKKLWTDDNLIAKYRMGCDDIKYDSVSEYARKLVSEIYE